MTPTHEQVLAAIDNARETRVHDPDGPFFRWGLARNAHCDDLRATAERHAPFLDILGMENCLHESSGTVDDRYMPWPCPDYRQVIVRLTWWGVL